MLWIQSHAEIGQHPKAWALSTALNVPITTTIGVLHLLWHFTLKFSWRTGDLSRFPAIIIARGVCWDGDPDLLLKALRDTGWLDEMVVHDWLQYAGKIVNDRLYNEERRANAVERRKTASNADKSRKTAVRVEQSRVEQSSKKIPPNPLRGPDTNFQNFWSLYPKKTGKGAAEKAWEKISFGPDLTAVTILQAVQRHASSFDWKKDGGQFIPNPATWLNQRRWEDELRSGNQTRPSSILDKVMGRQDGETRKDEQMGGLPDL